MPTLRLSFVFCLLLVCVNSPWAQSDRLERGKYLMSRVVACGNCHTHRTEQGQLVPEKELSGGQLFDAPAYKTYASNLTPDAATGIGKWTDAQLGKAIREGVRPDGSLIGQPMPVEFYRSISDEDLAAIIAYRPPMAFPYYKNINDADMTALIAYLRSPEPQPFRGGN